MEFADNNQLLKEDLENFQALLDQGLFGVIIYQDNSVKYVNQVIAEIVEYSREELLKWSYDDLKKIITPTEIDYVTEQARKKATGDISYEPQYIANFITRSNKSKTVQIYGKTIQYNGRPAAYTMILDITEHQKTRKDLLVTNKKYHELLNSIIEGVGIVDENETIEYCNPAFVKIFEADDPSELVGRSILDFIDDDTKSFLLKQTGQRKQNISNDYELEIITLKGNRKTISVAGSPKFNEDKFSGTFGVIYDITEKKNAQKAVQESERRFREMAETIEEGFWITSIKQGQKSEVLYISPRALNILGMTKDELLNLGDNWSKYIHEEDRKRVMDSVRKFMSEGGEYSEEYRAIHSSGNIKWISVKVYAIRNEVGEIIRTIGVVRDITKRKEAELKLRHSEEKFSKFFAATPIVLVISKMEDGEIVDTNDFFETFTGYTKEFAIGKKSSELGLWSDPEERKRMVQILGKGNSVRGFEATYNDKFGNKKNTIVSAEILELNSEKFLIGAIMDITARKEAELEKEKLIVELKDALDQVKTLRGYLAICASCKKIRDDKGFWEELEQYVRENSDLQFSHGLCPECARKLYPEIYEDE